MKVISELDLIMFNESDEATAAKRKIIDNYSQKEFEDFINTTFPDGITEEELNHWIIKYPEIMKSFWELLERQNQQKGGI
jgi:hypothetical protein